MEKEIIDKIKLLEEKYAQMGQDLNSYLDGLLLSNYLTYWDYTQVDTLLTLQNPKTDFPDELIFIIYHQITELNFRLSIHELTQIAHNGRDILPNGQDMGWKKKLDPEFMAERIMRVNRYFESLTKSFEIMTTGMDKEQFLRYRMALLPASGFQSAQYRMIEIMSTDFINLVDKEVRAKYNEHSPLDEMYEFIYWNKGATELATGKKTLTLKQFEKKYTEKFKALAREYKDINMWKKFSAFTDAEKKNSNLLNAMKQLDVNVNINWPLVHYKTAVRYLQQNTEDVAATGGTNWQKYLPPRFQKRIFFPQLWTDQEKEDWGRGWVETNVLKI
jgi:tryptophan 2,3-dioxygenase